MAAPPSRSRKARRGSGKATASKSKLPAKTKLPKRDAEIAKRVRSYAAVGLPMNKAAKILGMRDQTMRLVYRDDWDLGAAEADANIGKSLYEQAVGRAAEIDPQTRRVVREELKPDKSVSIFLGKVRLGMQERPQRALISITDLDFTVFTDEEFDTFKALYAKALKRTLNDEADGAE